MRMSRRDYDCIQPWPTKRAHIFRDDDGEVCDLAEVRNLGKHMNPIIPEDEPVFLLRGQDRCAPAAVIKYAEMLEAVGAAKEMVDSVYDWAQVMMDYQDAHFPPEEWQGVRIAGGKVPDADKAVLR